MTVWLPYCFSNDIAPLGRSNNSAVRKQTETRLCKHVPEIKRRWNTVPLQASSINDVKVRKREEFVVRCRVCKISYRLNGTKKKSPPSRTDETISHNHYSVREPTMNIQANCLLKQQEEPRHPQNRSYNAAKPNLIICLLKSK